MVSCFIVVSKKLKNSFNRTSWSWLAPVPVVFSSLTFASYAVTQTDVTFKCQAHYVPFILSGNRRYGGDGVCSGLEQIIFKGGLRGGWQNSGPDSGATSKGCWVNKGTMLVIYVTNQAHWCIMRTGCLTGNMAAQQFFPVVTQGTAHQNPRGLRKHFSHWPQCKGQKIARREVIPSMPCVPSLV